MSRDPRTGPRGTPPHRCTGRDCEVCERIAEARADAKRGG